MAGRKPGCISATLIGAPAGMAAWAWLPGAKAVIGAMGILLLGRWLVRIAAGELRDGPPAGRHRGP